MRVVVWSQKNGSTLLSSEEPQLRNTISRGTGSTLLKDIGTYGSSTIRETPAPTTPVVNTTRGERRREGPAPTLRCSYTP